MQLFRDSDKIAEMAEFHATTIPQSDRNWLDSILDHYAGGVPTEWAVCARAPAFRRCRHLRE
jgi:hypothetical protein